MRFFHIIFFIFLFLSNVYPQNNFTISGTIKNEKGELLIGTTVKVKGTTKGIITDINGNYSLLMQKGNHIIVYSFIGYESIEISVSLTKNIIQDVQLTSKMNQLDELVIYDNRIQEDIKSLVLVVILTEIAWRIFMEFFVAYFDMHRALKNKQEGIPD